MQQLAIRRIVSILEPSRRGSRGVADRASRSAPYSTTTGSGESSTADRCRARNGLWTTGRLDDPGRGAPGQLKRGSQASSRCPQSWPSTSRRLAECIILILIQRMTAEVIVRWVDQSGEPAVRVRMAASDSGPFFLSKV